MKWIVKFIVRQSPVSADIMETQVIEADKVVYKEDGTAVFFQSTQPTCVPSKIVGIVRDFSSITQVKIPE